MNTFAIPFIFATARIDATSRTAAKFTSLYLTGVRKVVEPSSMAAFNARLQDNPRGFGANQAKFFNSVESYSNVASGLALEVLQAISFSPQVHRLH